VAAAAAAASAAVKPSHIERLKLLWKQHGYVFIGTYGGIYVMTLGGLYVTLRNGWVGGQDLSQFAHWLGMEGEEFDAKQMKKGYFAAAWIATKFTEPLRLAATLAVVPFISRALGRTIPKEATVEEAAVQAEAAVAAEATDANVKAALVSLSVEQQQEPKQFHVEPPAAADFVPAGQYRFRERHSGHRITHQATLTRAAASSASSSSSSKSSSSSETSSLPPSSASAEKA
jgi:hypothetical protein